MNDNDSPMFSPGKVIAMVAGAFALAFMLFGLGGLVETNQAGYVKILQVPISGTMRVNSAPGAFLQMFGTVSEYKIAGTYHFSTEESEDSTNSPPVEVRFSDAGVAMISGNVRFDLPSSEQGILNVHVKFRSYEHGGDLKGLVTVMQEAEQVPGALAQIYYGAQTLFKLGKTANNPATGGK